MNAFLARVEARRDAEREAAILATAGAQLGRVPGEGWEPRTRAILSPGMQAVWRRRHAKLLEVAARQGDSFKAEDVAAAVGMPLLACRTYLNRLANKGTLRRVGPGVYEVPR